jgi:hypothetical protein
MGIAVRGPDAAHRRLASGALLDYLSGLSAVSFIPASSAAVPFEESSSWISSTLW